MQWPFLVCLAIVCVGGTDLNSLLVGPKCGQKTCKFLEYCSEYEFSCKPCDAVCNQAHHNFDKSVCQVNCQDYIREELYKSILIENQSNNGSTDPSLRASIDKLYSLVIATLVLILFLYIGIIGYFCLKLIDKQSGNYTLKSIRQRCFGGKEKKSNSTELDKTPNKVRSGNKTPAELRIEISNAALRNSSSDDTSPYTVSTNLSRKPAEDSALDYAYENPAMSASTPSPR